MRKVPLVTNNIYHVFNRGINKEKIFFSENDYSHLFATALHYKYNSSKFSYRNPNQQPNDPASIGLLDPPKVEILAYCFMPNHFHFVIKQMVEDGLTWYMRHVINSYVHYVNTKYKRFGPLLQGRFKAVHISTDEQLMHVSRYVHLNPVVSNLIENPEDYLWSSYNYYLNGKNAFCDPTSVLSYFKSPNAYAEFVKDHINYARSLEYIKHLVLE